MPLAKSAWRPSPLIGQIVLVSSRSLRGEVHVAAKSWISMVASEPPTLSLACRISHRTAINILETREFVVNVPGDEISPKVWLAAESLVSSSEGEPAVWTLRPATRVAPPLVEECRAHFECVLDSSKRFNDEELVLYGRILEVSVDERLLQGPAEERYAALRPLVYLEEGVYGILEGARRVESRDEQA
ncbi:MAG: flavin reductase [Acidobacteria bacterium]|nr:flavin reductase [Acidobacteriota bacterium]